MSKHKLSLKFALIVALAIIGGSAMAGPLILLIGDSTVATQTTVTGSGPSRGWGQVLPSFFSEDVTFKNAASNGRSSKSFIEEGKWSDALASQPQYIFILWGTNDANADPARHTDADTTFKDYLRKYIDESIAQNAVPVLVTPSAHRMFLANGGFKNSLAPYAEAMKEVALERKVALIDLNAATAELYERIGPEESAKLGATPTDKTHFNEAGATDMAKIIVAAIPANVPALTPFLKAAP